MIIPEILQDDFLYRIEAEAYNDNERGHTDDDGDFITQRNFERLAKCVDQGKPISSTYGGLFKMMAQDLLDEAESRRGDSGDAFGEMSEEEYNQYIDALRAVMEKLEE